MTDGKQADPHGDPADMGAAGDDFGQGDCV